MQPESSDGLASVGTILPEEKAACCRAAFSVFGVQISPRPIESSVAENQLASRPSALRQSRIAVKSPLEFADVAQLVEQLIRNQ
jgi:hypothetical protein